MLYQRWCEPVKCLFLFLSLWRTLTYDSTHSFYIKLTLTLTLLFSWEKQRHLLHPHRHASRTSVHLQLIPSLHHSSVSDHTTENLIHALGGLQYVQSSAAAVLQTLAANHPKPSFTFSGSRSSPAPLETLLAHLQILGCSRDFRWILALMAERSHYLIPCELFNILSLCILGVCTIVYHKTTSLWITSWEIFPTLVPHESNSTVFL